MKIKVESAKIVKAVKKLEGIEMVLENAEDAKEALNVILRRTDLLNAGDLAQLKEAKVSALQEYKTSAVDYTLVFLLEFIFAADASIDSKIGVIKALQEFFNKL
jgi:predicted aconitase